LEAVVGTIVAPITLATTIAIPSNRSGVAGTALFLVAMVAYYGVFSRHRLVAQAPLEAALLEAAQTEFSP
jgi:ethanolamine permease